MDLADLSFAIAGIGALLAGLLPRFVAGRPLSLPMAFLLLGVVVAALPLGVPRLDPLAQGTLVEHVTEVGVIIALMGAGLKLDRPVGWHRWGTTWRLLAITMPLGIAAIALLGGGLLGLAPAAALLLGAVLAPTDPVLASDVQVGEPTDAQDSEDDVRFGLTSEAGLNDGLAFPFTYAAIAMATVGAAPSGWLGEWLLLDVLYKGAVGLLGGVAVGWLLGRLFFRASNRGLRLAEHSEGFVALAATFLAYGATEVAGGYGFLAVFVCACSMRASERDHGYHRVLHDFTEQIERLLTVGVLLILGGAVVGGLLAPLTWQAALLGLLTIFIVRPLTGAVALIGSSAGPKERAVISFFGIRGLGSFYYLAYAVNEADFPDERLLYATVGFVVVVSVVVHGVLATPVMQRVDRARERHHAPAEVPGSSGPGEPQTHRAA